MPCIRTIIIDDEPLAIRNLKSILSASQDVDVIGEFQDPSEGLRSSQNMLPDLIFLDIQMPKMSGMTIAREVLKLSPAPMVVFVSAHDEYLMEAFRVHALNYVLKPVDHVQIEEIIARIRTRAMPKTEEFHESIVRLLSSKEDEDRYESRFLVKQGQKSIIVQTDEVVWISGAKNYVELHTSSKTFLLRKTMEMISNELDSRHFARIHRSIIININELDYLTTSYDNGLVAVLKDKSQHKVSKSYRQNLEGRFLQ